MIGYVLRNLHLATIIPAVRQQQHHYRDDISTSSLSGQVDPWPPGRPGEGGTHDVINIFVALLPAAPSSHLQNHDPPGARGATGGDRGGPHHHLGRLPPSASVTQGPPQRPRAAAAPPAASMFKFRGLPAPPQDAAVSDPFRACCVRYSA